MDNAIIPANPQPPALPCPELPGTSIFNQPAFPFHTKPYNHTPYEIKQLIDYWSRSGDNLREACAKYNIEYENFRELQHVFSDIDAYHAQARQKKADTYFEKSLESAEDDENDVSEVTKVCKNGDTLTYEQGNMVAVRRSELRQKAYMMAAERLSPVYQPKSETFNKSITANINLTVPVSKIGDQPMDSLLQAQGT